MTTYVDSSVVLRIILGEANRLADWDRLDPVSSQLTNVECLRAIERFQWTGSLDPATLAERRGALLTLLNAFTLAPISTAVIERAGDPFPTYVATLDAIHLATAVVLREELPEIGFATHDAKLAAAARSMGFAVIGV